MPANVFTPILRNLTTEFQRVAIERAPLPSIAQTDFRAEEAALDQIVTIPISPPVVGRNRAVGAAFTDAAARTVTNTSITITKDREFPFALTGDDFLRMAQNPEFIPSSITQAMRAWRNEIQSDLAGLHVDAAGYYSAAFPSSGAALGTAGTAPFASDITLLTGAEKLLNDSLAPLEGRFAFIDTLAKNRLGDLGQLTKANESGSQELLRRGIVGQLAGFNVIWGNDVKSHTAGSVTGAVTVTGTLGASSLTVTTGAAMAVGILKGDVVTIAGDTTRYVAAAALTLGASTSGTLTLTSGLILAPTTAAITVLATSRRNMAFHREALGLAIRLPALPPEGDAGAHQIITDPDTGIQVRLSTYKGVGLNLYSLSSAWGVKTVRPELLKLILG